MASTAAKNTRANKAAASKQPSVTPEREDETAGASNTSPTSSTENTGQQIIPSQSGPSNQLSQSIPLASQVVSLAAFREDMGFTSPQIESMIVTIRNILQMEIQLMLNEAMVAALQQTRTTAPASGPPPPPPPGDYNEPQGPPEPSPPAPKPLSAEQVGYFDPGYKKEEDIGTNTSPADTPVVSSGKHTYYRDVYVFVDRLKDVVA